MSKVMASPRGKDVMKTFATYWGGRDHIDWCTLAAWQR